MARGCECIREREREREREIEREREREGGRERRSRVKDPVECVIAQTGEEAFCTYRATNDKLSRAKEKTDRGDTALRKLESGN